MTEQRLDQKSFYYLGTLFLVGTKAIGLEERSWPFVVIFLLGSLLIACKMLFETYTVSEIVFFGLLIGYGIYVFFNVGSTGLLSLIILMIGMKGVDIKRLFRYLSIEYTVCFLITILFSIFGNRDGVELVHEKFGMIVLRQSLGYTHPNVLHVSYVILMALILYSADAHGKKLFRLLGILLLGDAFIFMYSLSSTGLLMSFALIAMFLYMELIHYRKGKEIPVFKIEKVLLYLWIPVSFFGFIILSRIVTLNNVWYEKANDIFNVRTWCINRYYDVVGLSIFGKPLNLPGVALDNSYAYGMFAYGVLFIILAFLAYVFTCRYLIQYNRFPEIAILIALTFGGITEQYLFNASFKNLTIFMVGEWLFESGFVEKIGSNIRVKLLSQHSFGKAFSPEGFKINLNKKMVYILCLLGVIVLTTALFSSGNDFETIYAPPQSVDVDIADHSVNEMTSDDGDRRSYEIGKEIHNETGRIYIFDNTNSLIPVQMKTEYRISVVFFILFCVIVFAYTLFYRKENENTVRQ